MNGNQGGFESQQEMMSHALSRIELFLLPPKVSPAGTGRDDMEGEEANVRYEKDVSHTPSVRLDEILFQIALADYIRTMQTMYRDNHDDQTLAADLRREGINTKLPLKHLMGKIAEGRSRSIPLLKLTCGESSVGLLKGYLDAASCYALQGAWPQVEEKILSANDMLKKISRVLSVQSSDEQIRTALVAAERVKCVYHSLRAHAIRNNGQILVTFVKEIMVALIQLPSHTDDDNDPLGHPAKFVTSLHLYLSSLPREDINLSTLKTNASESYYAERDRPHRSIHNRQPEEAAVSKSWGAVVEYLRQQCGPMKVWVDALYKGILPQDKAALALPFRYCDLQRRNIAHPAQLAQTIMSFPSAARVLIGTEMPKLLSQIKIEVPLFIDTRTASLLVESKQVQQIKNLARHGFDQQGGGSGLPPTQQVFYELPITFEEFIALFLLESRPSVESQVNLLKVQLYTIQGVCSIYTNHLVAAEDFLKKALNKLESQGLEMEIVACELYNSIAQMMIIQHRKWIAGRKHRLKDEAAEWLDTAEGQRELKIQVKLVRKQYSAKSYPVSSAEIELRAKTSSMKKRISQLTKQMDDSKVMSKTLEASYRYLVRSFEILENTHGPMHPSVGTACLAVASVQNLLEDYEDTRDWLMRALRYMEKLRPIPHRAISFTQIQLSQVLSKLGHDDQARMVLSNAAAFHMSQAQVGLMNHRNPAGNSMIGQQQPYEGNLLNQNQSQHQPPTSVLMQPPPPPPADNGDDVSTGGVVDGAPLLMVAAGGGGSAGNDLNYSMVSPPIMKNTPLYEDINTALEIMSKVMRMSTKCYDKWAAASQAEEIVRLTDSAFGWDSPQAAEAFKQAGIRCAAVSDWARACKFFKLGLESMVLLYGKMDFRTIGVAKLLHSARKGRNGGGATHGRTRPGSDVEGKNQNGDGEEDDDGGDEEEEEVLKNMNEPLHIMSAPPVTGAEEEAVTPVAVQEMKKKMAADNVLVS